MKYGKNFIINIIYIILGTALIITSAIGLIGDIYLGFGSGIAVVGIIQLIKKIRYITDKEYQEKTDIELSDERNKYISLKAWSWAGYLFVIIAGFTTIICMILSQTLYMQISAMAVCLIIVLYWISYIIIKRKN